MNIESWLQLVAICFLGAISPGMASGTIGKVIPAAAAFGIGGIEAAIGAVLTEVVGGSVTSFSGPNAEGNVQVESL